MLVIITKKSKEITKKRHIVYYKVGTMFTNIHTHIQISAGSDIIYSVYTSTHARILMFITLQCRF
jgi:hypothetical protein